MTDDPEPRAAPARPALTSKAESEKQARIEREARALRENLRRRKQQVRDREEAGRTPE